MAIKTSYGSVTDWLSNKEYTPLVTPEDMRNSRTAELQGLGTGDLYGIEYDMGAIEGIYNRATDAQYALKQKEYQAAENQYYRNMYASQNSAIDALRAQRADQIATGMSAGLAAAAESATAMGLQDTNAAGALELANQRQMMADEIAAAYAENIVKAFETSQSARQAIAGLDLDKYTADTEFDAALIGGLGYLEQAAANVYAAQLGEYATIAQGLMGAQAQLDSANITAAANGAGQPPIGTDEWFNQFVDENGYIDVEKYRNDASAQGIDASIINTNAQRYEAINKALFDLGHKQVVKQHTQIPSTYSALLNEMTKKGMTTEQKKAVIAQIKPLLEASEQSYEDFTKSTSGLGYDLTELFSKWSL